jgi:hypothetical protein
VFSKTVDFHHPRGEKYSKWDCWGIENYLDISIPIDSSFLVVGKLITFLENEAAAGETFREAFVTLRRHFTAYCTCREAVKLFRFLLSPCSLINSEYKIVCGVRGMKLSLMPGPPEPRTLFNSRQRTMPKKLLPYPYLSTKQLLQMLRNYGPNSWYSRDAVIMNSEGTQLQATINVQVKPFLCSNNWAARHKEKGWMDV